MRKAGKSKFDLAVIRLVTDYREANGYTQDDLAFFLDVSLGYIGQIEVRIPAPNTTSTSSTGSLRYFGVNKENFVKARGIYTF